LSGIYGDVIEEIDWSVGQIVESLKAQGLAENTLVVFTSDNGPWHIFKTHGGSCRIATGSQGRNL
jgi:arylsulfatase A